MPIRIVDRKRFTLLIAIVLAAVGMLILLGVKLSKKETGKEESKQRVYEALIQPFDQNSTDSAKEDPSALEKGDVIVIFPEGHPWSDTEKTSYLILKLKLTEEDANKLVEPETETVQGKDGEEGRAAETKTVRARKYRINIESLNFDLQKFWEIPVQPYPDKALDNSLIQTK